MSKAQVRARNMSKLLNNLGNNGALSLAAMQLHLPPVVAVRWNHTGESLRIGRDWLKGTSGTADSGWPACTRVRIEGHGDIAAEVTFYYQGYGDRTVRAKAKGEGETAITFPVPLPSDWRYPDVAGRLANMSRQGEFG